MNSFEVRATWSLASLFGLRMLGLFMILPVFALYSDQLEGITPQLMGLAIGVYGLTQACLQVPFGFLSDRIGRKPVIVFGLLIFCLGSMVAAEANTIQGVIIGRALQGGGAIASTMMALLSDLTRDDQRSKAMAMVGASIGVSFILALIIGPIVSSWLGLSGLFWLTAILAVLGVGMALWVVPTPEKTELLRDTRAIPSYFGDVIRHPELLRLDLGVFLLHMTMTASFVVLPTWLMQHGGLASAQHWQVYLPVLFGSFVVMLPMMMAAEKRHRIKQVFLMAVGLMAGSMLLLSQWHNGLFILVIGLFLFFWGFNLLEAMLPSLVSKIAPPGLKGTSMGVYSTCQFLGAFVGGVGGGWILTVFGDDGVYLVCGLLVCLWLAVAAGMKQPVHLQSYTLQLDSIDASDVSSLVRRLMSIAGVEEAVVVPEDKAAYLKVDNQCLDKEQLMLLSQAAT